MIKIDKKIFLYPVKIILLGCSLTLSSCYSNQCEYKSCKYGNCINGYCFCTEGWGGESCDSLNQFRAIGFYEERIESPNTINCTSSTFSDPFGESMQVVAGSGDLDLIFKSSSFPDLNVKIELNPHIYIPMMEVNNFKYYGSGMISRQGGGISFDFHRIDENIHDTCHAYLYYNKL